MVKRTWSHVWVRLGLGFAVLLVLITASNSITFRETVRIVEELSGAYERHQQVGDALNHLQSDLYLAGILKRDFLLDPAPSHGPRYGEQFATLRESTGRHLKTLETLLTAEQSAPLGRLRTEVSNYMRPLDQALDWEPLETAAVRWQLLRLQLRQRDSALQMAADIDKLNRRSLSIQRENIRAAEQQFRQQLLLMAATALMLAALIAGFTVWHMRRLETQSEQAKAELRQLSHQVVKVQEEERKAISRELHDEVGQMLTGLRMELANLDGPHARQDPVFYQRLLETKNLAERTLKTVRNMAMVLRPSMLDDLGLSPALRWQAREFSRHSGVPVDLSIDGDVDALPDEVRTCLYRVVQEALTNAGRHARAKHIQVWLERKHDSVVSTVQDDGVGFSRSSIKYGGLGLLGMEERVRELDGRVDILSEPGRGTRIRVAILLPALLQ